MKLQLFMYWIYIKAIESEKCCLKEWQRNSDNEIILPFIYGYYQWVQREGFMNICDENI